MENVPLGMQRLWLSPFPVEVRGGLRQNMNQFADPSGTTILTPKSNRGSNRSAKQHSHGLIPPAVDPPTPPPVTTFNGAMLVFNGSAGTFQSIPKGVSGTTIVYHVGTPPPAFSLRVAIFISTTECDKGAIVYSWTEDGVDMGVSSGYIGVTVSNGNLGSTTYICTLTFPDLTTATFEVTLDVQV